MRLPVVVFVVALVSTPSLSTATGCPASTAKHTSHANVYGSNNGSVAEIFGFLAFDKVGSTTMRQAIIHYLAARGLSLFSRETDRYRPRACDPAFPSHELVYTYERHRITGVSVESTTTRHDCTALADSSVVNLDAMPALSRQNVLGVTQTWIRRVVMQGRTPRYFTLIRDPIARVRSAYSYFCQSCAENGRQCGRTLSHLLRCPNMTIVEYAAVFGNVYTTFFSALLKLAGDGGRAKVADVFREMIKADIFVMITDVDMLMPEPFVGLGQWMNSKRMQSIVVKRQNSHAHNKTILRSDEQRLQHILADDILLYNMAKENACARLASPV